MSRRRQTGRIVAGIVLGSLLYLLVSPVPIAPIAWDAPADAGLVHPFERNNRLASAQLAALTGVFETRDALWLSSLFGHRVGKLDQ